MDTSVKPGDDFYRYVNGKWLDRFKIPADRASYGTGTVVFEKTEADLHAIVDELAASKPPRAAWIRRSPTCTAAGWTKPPSKHAASSR